MADRVIAVRFPAGSYRLFSFRIIYILALWHTQPPLLLVLGGVEIKWPGREAEHSLPFGAEVDISYRQTHCNEFYVHGTVHPYSIV